MVIYQKPPNTYKITRVWAFCSEDEAGLQGLIASQAGGAIFPLITPNRTHMEHMLPMAMSIGKETGTKVVLMTFDVVSTETVYER